MTEPPTRRAGADDAAAIARVHVESWRATYPGIVPQTILDALSLGRRTEQWRETIAGGATIVRVAELGGQVAGFIAAGPARDEDVQSGTGEIRALYLAPAVRGRGLGRRLLEDASRELAAAGLAPIVLWVLSANGAARRFYAAAGFEPDGAVRELDFDGQPVEELRMVRQDR